jgi:hypothetical protein
MLRGVGRRSVFWRAALSLCLAACSKMDVCLDEPKPVPFEVQINVMSDPGVPLGEAQILHGTKVVGQTNATGSATLHFGGAEGDQVDLIVKGPGPADYESPAKPLTVSSVGSRPDRSRPNSRPAARLRCGRSSWASGPTTVRTSV